MPTQRVLQYNAQVGNALKKASRIPEANAGSAETTVPRQPLMMRQAEGGSGGETSTVTTDYVYHGAFNTELVGTDTVRCFDGVERETGICGVIYIGNTAIHASNCTIALPNDGSTEGLNVFFFVVYDGSTGTDRGYYTGLAYELATSTSAPTGTYTSSGGTEKEVDFGEYDQSFYTPLCFVKRAGSVTRVQTYMQDYMRIDGRFVE